MSLAAVISATGISAPSYAEILASLTASFQSIYGSDAVLTPDSQDGQWIAIIAQAINDGNQAAIAVYNQFSPATAQGTGLSSVVKINGLARLVSSASTATVAIGGQQGTILNGALIGDDLQLGTQWSIPDGTVIPNAGTINVTATCTQQGAVAIPAGHLTEILTPTAGWQSVTNAADAVPGAPVESDATLRQRQAVSTALPAQSVIGGIFGALANLSGVQRLAIYENDTGSPDANGVPAHSISVVIQGGDTLSIAQTIEQKKTPGTGTYGSTSEVVTDPVGVPVTIDFYQLAVVQMDVVVNITALAGYVSTTATAIKEAIAGFLSGLDIGEDSYIARLYSPANLSGDAAAAATGQTQAALDLLSKTYNITAITQARHSGTQHPLDVVINFNEATAGTIANITVTVS